MLTSELATTHQACLISALSSFPLDYIARQKISGSHMTLVNLQQLPVPDPDQFDHRAADPIGVSRPLDLAAYLDSATHRGTSKRSPATSATRARPSDGIRRAANCCGFELDAAFFHLYGIERDDVDYIMETFPIVKRKDVAA